MEQRTVLSTTLSEAPVGCSLDELNVAIREVTLRINGQETVLQRSESTVVVNEGDVVELYELDYAVKAAPSCEAVIAGEAYFRKGTEFDYADGRCGDSRGTDPFAETDMVLAINGDWRVESDWDRMSIPLLGYSEEDVRVYDRFFINFKVVDERDLAFSLSHTIDALRNASFVVGQKVELPGTWINNSQTPQTADMEVQVFTLETGTSPIWTGRFTATVSPGERVEGSFTDANGNPWVPTDSGIHFLRFSVDPDDVLQERAEWNNWGLLPILVVSEASK